jgi:diamine N-acetyltransferase
MNVYRRGDKVYLRPLERSDAAVVAPWFNDEEIQRYISWYRPLTVEHEAERIAQMAADPRQALLGVAAIEGGLLVGVCGLHDIDARTRAAWYGIAIGDKGAWGRGYGTETTRLVLDIAFATYNLNRVELRVNVDHPAALHVYEKCGFRREGVLRQAAVGRDGYQDLIVMSILRGEWSPG